MLDDLGVLNSLRTRSNAAFGSNGFPFASRRWPRDSKLRDIRFLVEHPHSRNRAYGRRVLEALRQMFAVIHRRDEYSANDFAIELQNAGDELVAQAIYRVPSTNEARTWRNGLHDMARATCNSSPRRASSRRTISRNRQSVSW